MSPLRQLPTEREGLTLYCGDALDLLASVETASVDLIATDPPYHRVKTEEAWDMAFKTDADFLAWMGRLCDEWKRVLKPNGSLYVFASPDMAGRVECVIRERLNVLNVVRWLKDAGWHQKTAEESLRSYLSPWEAVIFAEQFGADGSARGLSGWAHKCEELRGFVFEPLRAYLDSERLRAGISFEQVREMVGCAPGSGLPSHWFTKSQWSLPTAIQYAKLQAGFNGYLDRPYTYLRSEYEALRSEYEALRRPFSASEHRPYTDVWEFPTVATYPGKHPCQKPAEMLEHIILTSSRPGDLVLDCFMGSGATGHAALSFGRRFVGGDASEHWAQYALARLERRFGALPQGTGRTAKPKRRDVGMTDLFATLGGAL